MFVKHLVTNATSLGITGWEGCARDGKRMQNKVCETNAYKVGAFPFKQEQSQTGNATATRSSSERESELLRIKLLPLRVTTNAI